MFASLALLLASSQAATTPVRTAPCTSASPRPRCRLPTVHKIVDFDLEPGRYLLQIAGNETATLRLMVSRS